MPKIPVPIYLCRFTIVPGMETVAVSQISEATKPEDRPAVIDLLDRYSLTAEQLLVVLRLSKRRSALANKLFNGPELNQVSYKTIVWCQQFYSELTERIETELLQSV